MRRFIPDYGTLKAMVRLLQNFSRKERERLLRQTNTPLMLKPHELHSLFLVWTRIEAQDEVLRSALSFLSQKVNVSTGIMHPSDEKLCVELFSGLRGLLIPLNSYLIPTILTKKHGWDERRALVVRSLVEDIYGGKNPRCRQMGISIKKGVIEGWIVEAAPRFRSGQ